MSLLQFPADARRVRAVFVDYSRAFLTRKIMSHDVRSHTPSFALFLFTRLITRASTGTALARSCSPAPLIRRRIVYISHLYSFTDGVYAIASKWVYSAIGLWNSMGTCALYDRLTSSLMVAGNNSPAPALAAGICSSVKHCLSAAFISSCYCCCCCCCRLIRRPNCDSRPPSGHCADNASATPDNNGPCRGPCPSAGPDSFGPPDSYLV